LQIASLQHIADTQYYEFWLLIEVLTDFLVSAVNPFSALIEDRKGRARNINESIRYEEEEEEEADIDVTQVI